MYLLKYIDFTHIGRITGCYPVNSTEELEENDVLSEKVYDTYEIYLIELLKKISYANYLY